jgi:hypothetical protein
MRSRHFQELNVLQWVFVAVDEFVNLLFATQNVSVSLEKTFFGVIENGHAERLYFEAGLT